MTRKLFAATLFAVACAAMLYASSADAADEAPAPRAVGEGDKKPEGKGKFGGFGKGGFGGKIDPEKLKELKEKFGKGGGFPFPGGGKGGFPFPGGGEKGKFGKEGFPGGKGGFPFPGGGKGKKGGDKGEE
jgi:hypothetical protein